jgi:hypothetical protein
VAKQEARDKRRAMLTHFISSHSVKANLLLPALTNFCKVVLIYL